MLQWCWFGWINGRNHLEFEFQLPHSNLEKRTKKKHCLMSQLISQGLNNQSKISFSGISFRILKTSIFFVDFNQLANKWNVIRKTSIYRYWIIEQAYDTLLRLWLYCYPFMPAFSFVSGTLKFILEMHLILKLLNT